MTAEYGYVVETWTCLIDTWTVLVEGFEKKNFEMNLGFEKENFEMNLDFEKENFEMNLEVLIRIIVG